MSERRNLNEDIYNAALIHALGNLADKQNFDDSEILNKYMLNAEEAAPKLSRLNPKRMFAKAQKKTTIRMHSKSMRRTILTFAATFVIVFVLPLATQASILDFFDWAFNRNNVYTSMEEVNRMENENIVEVLGNSGWSYFYFPQNIPKDFILYSVQATRKSSCFIFTNENKIIEFRQFPLKKVLNPSFSGTYDNENIEYGKEIVIGGKNGYFIKKDNVDIISFDNSDYYFEFRYSGLSKTDAIKIASNLKKVTK